MGGSEGDMPMAGHITGCFVPSKRFRILVSVVLFLVVLFACL